MPATKKALPIWINHVDFHLFFDTFKLFSSLSLSLFFVQVRVREERNLLKTASYSLSIIVVIEITKIAAHIYPSTRNSNKTTFHRTSFSAIKWQKKKKKRINASHMEKKKKQQRAWVCESKSDGIKCMQGKWKRLSLRNSVIALPSS